MDLTIDPVTLAVSDLERAKAFYAAALGALGLALVGEVSAEVTRGMRSKTSNAFAHDKERDFFRRSGPGHGGLAEP